MSPDRPQGSPCGPHGHEECSWCEPPDPSGAKHKGQRRAWAVERDGEPVRWMVAYVFEATEEQMRRHMDREDIAVSTDGRVLWPSRFHVPPFPSTTIAAEGFKKAARLVEGAPDPEAAFRWVFR